MPGILDEYILRGQRMSNTLSEHGFTLEQESAEFMDFTRPASQYERITWNSKTKTWSAYAAHLDCNGDPLSEYVGAERNRLNTAILDLDTLRMEDKA